MTSIREMTASDRRYVVPTWARSSPWNHLTLAERFARVDRILARTGVSVVCLAEGTTVHAWAARDTRGLLYVYVPPELQANGLARELVAHLGGYQDDQTKRRMHRAAEQAAARRARAGKRAA